MNSTERFNKEEPDQGLFVVSPAVPNNKIYASRMNYIESKQKGSMKKIYLVLFLLSSRSQRAAGFFIYVKNLFSLVFIFQPFPADFWHSPPAAPPSECKLQSGISHWLCKKDIVPQICQCVKRTFSHKFDCVLVLYMLWSESPASCRFPQPGHKPGLQHSLALQFHNHHCLRLFRSVVWSTRWFHFLYCHIDFYCGKVRETTYLPLFRPVVWWTTS